LREGSVASKLEAEKGGIDMRNALVIFWVAVFAFGCSTSTVGPKLGEQFDLKLGQQVTVQNEGLTIKFKAVDNDSRCPEGAKCVWVGNAKVAIVVSQTDITLNTYSDPKQVTYSNYTLRLISLSPYPKLYQPINPQDYVAKLIVTKN
jgi:hypothetical protein